MRLFAPLALLSVGCTHRVEIVTDPVGASVSLGQRRLGPSPVTARLHPFGHRRFTAQLAGYRALTVTLPLTVTTTSFVGDILTFHWPRAFGFRTHTTVELRLVPEHGGMGTWNPDDVE